MSPPQTWDTSFPVSRDPLAPHPSWQMPFSVQHLCFPQVWWDLENIRKATVLFICLFIWWDLKILFRLKLACQRKQSEAQTKSLRTLDEWSHFITFFKSFRSLLDGRIQDHASIFHLSASPRIFPTKLKKNIKCKNSILLQYYFKNPIAVSLQNIHIKCSKM